MFHQHRFLAEYDKSQRCILIALLQPVVLNFYPIQAAPYHPRNIRCGCFLNSFSSIYMKVAGSF